MEDEECMFRDCLNGGFEKNTLLKKREKKEEKTVFLSYLLNCELHRSPSQQSSLDVMAHVCKTNPYYFLNIKILPFIFYSF